MKPSERASIERGLRNKLMMFATAAVMMFFIVRCFCLVEPRRTSIASSISAMRLSVRKNAMMPALPADLSLRCRMNCQWES